MLDQENTYQKNYPEDGKIGYDNAAQIRRDRKIPIMLGGEHSITTGAVRNFKDSNMVIIDAHSDFRDTYFGSKFNHACVTHRCLEILGKDRITSINMYLPTFSSLTSASCQPINYQFH